MLDRYFSIPEIADRLSLSQRTIKREIVARRLQAVRMTERGDYRVSEEALREWLSQREHGSPPAA